MTGKGVRRGLAASADRLDADKLNPHIKRSPVLKLARSVHWRFLRPCSRTPSSGLSSSDLGA
jgi:hypothetical protein